MQVLELIDKLDNFQIVQKQLVELLKAETINQRALATDAGKDPGPWTYDVHEFLARPWEVLLDPNGKVTTNNAAVVYFQEAAYQEDRSDWISEIQGPNNFGILILSGRTTKNEEHGDALAANAALATAALIRNIIQASLNHVLQLPDVVTNRMIDSIRVVQPDAEDNVYPSIYMVWLGLRVNLIETAPDISGAEMTIDLSITDPAGNPLADAEYRG